MNAILSAKARRKSPHLHSSLILLTSSTSPDSMEPWPPLPQTLLSTTSSLRLLCISVSFRLKQPQADNIPSAKRYERMMKANGIHQSQSGPTTVSSIRDTPVPSPRRKTSPSAGPSNKKRKLDSYAETTSNVNTDDDEGLCNVKTESSIKAEVKAEPIKEDPTMEEVTADSTASIGTFQPAFRDTMGFDGANDGSLFDDFLAFGGSLPTMGNGDEHGNKETILIAD